MRLANQITYIGYQAVCKSARKVSGDTGRGRSRTRHPLVDYNYLLSESRGRCFEISGLYLQPSLTEKKLQKENMLLWVVLTLDSIFQWDLGTKWDLVFQRKSKLHLSLPFHESWSRKVHRSQEQKSPSLQLDGEGLFTTNI